MSANPGATSAGREAATASPGSPRDADRLSNAMAVVSGLLAAGAFIAFVPGQAAAIFAAPATAARMDGGLATLQAGAAIEAAAEAVAPDRAPPQRGRAAATAVVRSGTAGHDAPPAAGAADEAAAGVQGVAIQPPPPYLTFRRPFAATHAVEGSRYYPYGTRGRGEYLLHHGVDIGNAHGTPVLAVAPGEVVHAGDDMRQPWGPMTNFYGNLVVVRHAVEVDGVPLSTLYGHLSQVTVATGQQVAAGDVLGQVGMTGIALGPHLHLEVRAGDPRDYQATRNPELFLVPIAGRGTLVGRVRGSDGALAPTTRVALFRQDGAGSTYYAEATTYPLDLVNSSSALGENVVFADLPEGAYTVQAQVGGRRTSAEVAITAAGVTMVDLRP